MVDIDCLGWGCCLCSAFSDGFVACIIHILYINVIPVHMNRKFYISRVPYYNGYVEEREECKRE